MKTIINKLITWWRAETPLFARVLQAVCVALVFLPTYFNSLPMQFQNAFTPGEIRGTAIGAIIAGVILNFSTKKSKK